MPSMIHTAPSDADISRSACLHSFTERVFAPEVTKSDASDWRKASAVLWAARSEGLQSVLSPCGLWVVSA